jgi:F5/8 type C domain
LDSFVSVDVSAGSTSGQKNTITLTVDPSSLPLGPSTGRIRIDGGGNNFHVLAVRFQVKAGAPVAAVTASSELSGYPASKAVDGDISSRWAATDNSYPQWLKLDLGAVRTINKVRTLFYQFSSRTYSYEIQTSVDDASYATAVASKNSSQTVEWNEDSFPATGVRFVRVSIAGCSDPAGYAQITEIEVLGP